LLSEEDIYVYAIAREIERDERCEAWMCSIGAKNLASYDAYAYGELEDEVNAAEVNLRRLLAQGKASSSAAVKEAQKRKRALAAQSVILQRCASSGRFCSSRKNK
jgi:hypothetical protein